MTLLARFDESTSEGGIYDRETGNRCTVGYGNPYDDELSLLKARAIELWNVANELQESARGRVPWDASLRDIRTRKVVETGKSIHRITESMKP